MTSAKTDLDREKKLWIDSGDSFGRDEMTCHSKSLSDFNLTDGSRVGRCCLMMGKIVAENRAVCVTERCEMGGETVDVFRGGGFHSVCQQQHWCL